MKKYEKPIIEATAFTNDDILLISGLSSGNSNSKFKKGDGTNSVTLS
jgi:hypothetical protein